ncbi:MAG: TAXI family TRAP transporter solute-binding subunit [Vicinamibacterales bacterium]
MTNWKSVIGCGVLVAAAACGGGSSQVRFLSIATGGTGGVYYPYGGALARVLSTKLKDTQVTAEVTGASVDNLKLMQQGRADLAFTLADTLLEAVAGTGPFAETGKVDARSIAVLYTNYTHLVARQGSGISRVADLKGRVVSTGAPGSGTELIADRLLVAAGIDPRQGITRHALGASESAGALKDGKVDAFFWSGGLPTSAIQDLAATPGLSIALISQADLLPALQQRYGPDLYRGVTMPGGTYRGTDAPVEVVGVSNVLVASGRLEPELVEKITSALFEAKTELTAAHPEARHLKPATDVNSAPVPFHEGSLRYYQARGWR